MSVPEYRNFFFKSILKIYFIWKNIKFMFVLVFFDNFNMLVYKKKKNRKKYYYNIFLNDFKKNITAISNINLDGYS